MISKHLTIESQIVLDRLLKAEQGEIVTYAELSELIGVNAQEEGYRYVAAARRKALNDRSAVFEAVSGLGIKRLHGEEVVDHASSTIVRMRRAAQRGMKKLTSLSEDEYANLPNEHKIKHNTVASMLGALTVFTSKPAALRVEAAVSRAHASLPLQRTLEAFSEKKPAPAPKDTERSPKQAGPSPNETGLSPTETAAQPGSKVIQ